MTTCTTPILLGTGNWTRADTRSLVVDWQTWGAWYAFTVAWLDFHTHGFTPNSSFSQPGLLLSCTFSPPFFLIQNLRFLIIACCSAGYPLITFFTKHPLSTLGGFNLGGINATGQIASIPGNWALIDKDTPQSAYSKPSYAEDGVTLDLVFSDEFNVDGRSFYPGGKNGFIMTARNLFLNRSL